MWKALPTSGSKSNTPSVYFFGYVPLLECVQIYFFPASARAQTVLNIMYERKKKTSRLEWVILDSNLTNLKGNSNNNIKIRKYAAQ